jgi:hypothetical protein
MARLRGELALEAFDVLKMIDRVDLSSYSGCFQLRVKLAENLHGCRKKAYFEIEHASLQLSRASFDAKREIVETQHSATFVEPLIAYSKLATKTSRSELTFST